MIITKNRVIILFIIALFLFTGFISSLSYAKDPEASYSAKNDSFVTFWPITAGKTIDDNLYFLKQWKEKLQGVFSFTPISKANYNIFLGTKRIIEAEKLLRENKEDYAVETLDLAYINFQNAVSSYKEARKSNSSTVLDGQTKDRLHNLSNFLPLLAEKRSDKVVFKIKSIEEKIKETISTP